MPDPVIGIFEVHILSRFRGKLYTPEAHNEMVSFLSENGVDGDLDEIVQAFANVQPSAAALILKQAKAIRHD